VVLERQKAFDQKDGRPNLAASNRHGDGSSEILDVSLLNENGEDCRVISSGQRIRIRIRTVFNDSRSEPMVAF